MFRVFSKLLFIILLFTTAFSFAAVRYVSKTGSSTPPYLSRETAADSIQKCINISSYGDTIYVGRGVYIETVSMINGLSLIGAGWDSCFIDTRTIAPLSGGFYAVTMQDNCLVEGFHIKVKANNSGIGISVQDNLTDPLREKAEIRNNKFSLAVWAIDGSSDLLIIRDNIFENCERGISLFGVYPSNQHLVYDNYLIDILGFGIITDLGAGALIYNNIIQMNRSYSEGIGTHSQTPSQIFNNLVIQKTQGVQNSGGIYLNNVPNVAMNNFVINNFNSGIASATPSIVKNNVVVNCQGGFRGTGTIKYNNAFGNGVNYYGFTPDSTNLSVDPMIVSQDELDFHLQMFSPLIDAGDPGILDPDSTRSDIGLYGGPYGEITSYKDLPPKAPKGLWITADSGIIHLGWKRNTEADFSSYTLYSDTIAGFTADSSTVIDSSFTDTVYTQIKPEGVSRIFYKLKASDNQGNISPVSDEVGVVLLGAKDGDYQVIQDYSLYQNYPNPFNPTTRIPFRLKQRGYVKLNVYDINGQLVSTLINQEMEAGYHEAEFTTSVKEELIPGIASGIYIYQIDVKNSSGIPQFRQSGKMILLK